MALAKQARAELDARARLFQYESLPPDRKRRGEKKLPRCIELHLLQMACEKLCKAHLFISPKPPAGLLRRHDFIEGTLDAIFLMKFSETYKKNLGQRDSLYRRVKLAARDIGALVPKGSKKENCEYPWCDEAGNIFVPAERPFANLDFLYKDPKGALFLNLVAAAIDSLCQPAPLPPSILGRE